MKKIMKMILIGMVFLFVLGGCQTQKLDGGVQKKTEDVKEQSTKQEPDANQEEDYFDVSDARQDEVDYSKYQDKKDGSKSTGEENPYVTYSDGADTKEDQYQTESVPEGKPNPVEPDEVEINKEKEYTRYLTISCSVLLDHMDALPQEKQMLVPDDGVIYAKKKVKFYEGESVFDVLKRETQKKRIHMESSFTPKYNSAYVEGINNLYEFDAGRYSGWLYKVNGWYPNYGCSRYLLKDGDVVEWQYTCDGGRDVGRN